MKAFYETADRSRELSAKMKDSKSAAIKTVIAVFFLSLVSCETTGDHKNMVAGSIIGAGAGALSGTRNGKAGRNAAIGAVTGALAGAAKDKNEKKKREAAARRKAEWASKTPAERNRIRQNEARAVGAVGDLLIGAALGGGSASSGSEVDRNTNAYYMPPGLGGNGAR